MLQACLNGGLTRAEHPRVPLTPAELANAAARARTAGARELHLHPRARDGTETLAPDAVAAALTAVREAVPDMPVGVGTGDWIAPGGRARQRDIAGWTVRPDHASVNLKETDAFEVMALLADMGVGIEAGVWSLADAERLLTEGRPGDCLRILVEMPDEAPEAALAEAARVLDALAEAGIDRPILLHGDGASAWACLREAGRRGLDTRIGLEDARALPDGAPAPDNAALVAAAAAILTG